MITTSRRVALGAAAVALAAPASTVRHAAAQGTTAPVPKRVVFVVSNPATMAPENVPIGYWLPELAHPWWRFAQAGMTQVIASPRGGPVMHDAMSDPEGGRFGNPRDVASLGFKNAASVRAELEATRPIAGIRIEDFDAIFVVGGFGPPTTFMNEEPLHRLFAAFHAAGKVAAAICHGTCILLRARTADGTLLAAGKRWTGYTDLEEDVVDRVMGRRFQPFRIQETATRERIGAFVEGLPYRPHAVADGNLVTGQQGSSGLATAELVLRVLG